MAASLCSLQDMLELNPECSSFAMPPSLRAAAGGMLVPSSDHDWLRAAAGWRAAGAHTQLEKKKREKM